MIWPKRIETKARALYEAKFGKPFFYKIDNAPGFDNWDVQNMGVKDEWCGFALSEENREIEKKQIAQATYRAEVEDLMAMML